MVDLERPASAIIQIDEPAFREGLPLRQADWQAYLDWAVDCFRLSAAGVRDETQIHTHMCYSEFNDIIEAIAAMDADVISIETSRSEMELLDAFAVFAIRTRSARASTTSTRRACPDARRWLGSWRSGGSAVTPTRSSGSTRIAA